MTYQPTKDLKLILKNWQRIKDEIQDTECGGETWDFLAEYVNPETGTAQHALWRGCEKIVKLCLEINDQINMSYPHPIIITPVVSDEIMYTAGMVKSRIEYIRKNEQEKANKYKSDLLKELNRRLDLLWLDDDVDDRGRRYNQSERDVYNEIIDIVEHGVNKQLG